MRNSIIIGFNIGVKGAAHYEVVLDNVQINSCKADAINLKQPDSVIISRSVIEKCRCYGILIKINGDTTKNITPRSSLNHSAMSLTSRNHRSFQISEG